MDEIITALKEANKQGYGLTTNQLHKVGLIKNPTLKKRTLLRRLNRHIDIVRKGKAAGTTYWYKEGAGHHSQRSGESMCFWIDLDLQTKVRKAAKESETSLAGFITTALENALKKEE